MQSLTVDMCLAAELTAPPRRPGLEEDVGVGEDDAVGLVRAWSDRRSWRDHGLLVEVGLLVGETGDGAARREGARARNADRGGGGVAEMLGVHDAVADEVDEADADALFEASTLAEMDSLPVHDSIDDDEAVALELDVPLGETLTDADCVTEPVARALALALALTLGQTGVSVADTLCLPPATPAA